MLSVQSPGASKPLAPGDCRRAQPARTAVRREEVPREERRMGVQERPCVRCGTTIPAARLEALPETRLCIACSREVGSDFEVTFVPANLAKSGSLKKNYADWTIRKRRRPIQAKDE
jgi:hypothetical protein